MLLTGWGMRVTTVGTVQAARAAVARQVPDLLLTDFRLDGDETGIQTISVLRDGLAMRLPALIVSGDDIEAMTAAAAGLGVEIVAKPVDDAMLQRAMRSALVAAA